MLTKRRDTACAAILGMALMASSGAGADSHATVNGQIDEEALARRITEEVMRELEQGNFLQQQIELGIQKYIRKQRQAQARAREERDQNAARLAQDVRRVSAERDHIYGNPTARISLIEYSDYECPYCKRFHPVAKQAVDGSGGEVNWVYRHFPLEFHNPLARKQAEAAECAGAMGGNAAFWRYSDLIYDRTRSNGNGFPMDGLVPLAGEIGLNESQFRDCLSSGRYSARVAEDLEEGKSIGISGTPGNVLLDNETGRVRVVSGAVPLDRLNAEIAAMLTP